ncbi:unnamed protein product, partial [Candidula unifasciata]
VEPCQDRVEPCQERVEPCQERVEPCQERVEPFTCLCCAIGNGVIWPSLPACNSDLAQQIVRNLNRRRLCRAD